MSAYVKNCTKDPRYLVTRVGPLTINVMIQPGETKKIGSDAWKELKKNPSIRNLLRCNLIQEVKEKKVKALADAKAKAAEEAKAQAAAAKKAKVEKQVKAAKLDDDAELDLD